jgi:hypothetical protein
MNLLALLLLLTMLLRRVGPAVACNRRRGGSDAAVRGLRGRSVAGELPLPGVKEADGKLLSETLLRSGGELLGGFFKLGAKGLEDHQLGVVFFNALAREVIGRFDDRNWSLFEDR